MLSLITSPLTAVLGYLYPAYMTFKAVEKRQPNIDELLFWGKYWIVVGVLCAVESFFLGLLLWIPFYGTARLLLLVYMWHPRTQGVLFLYHRAVQPVLLRHEPKIDVALEEIHTRGADMATDALRRAIALLQSGLQQGQGMVKNQYQSFSKRYSGPGAPPPSYPPVPGYPVYPPQPQAAAPAAPAAAGDRGAGQAVDPDSIYNLRSRRGYEAQPGH